MTNDFYLVIGLAILVLSVPAVIGALSAHRAPRAAAIAILIGGGLVALAVSREPGGYDIKDIPDAVYRVFAQVIR